MVKEYFIINSKSKNSNPNFYSFNNPLDTKAKIEKIFTNENCKWTESKGSNGIFLQAFYKTEIAHIKIEILKTKKEKNYIFQLIVLEGNNPLCEVSRLCKLNYWNAFDAKTDEYLDLEKYPEIRINEEDKKKYLDDYWVKFNELQVEIENDEFEVEDKINIVRVKKWWKFW
ncbi:hypothetical protein CVT91_05170 [Candidatus Atribacteria bacterium HGW-Atribacteria-1]|nr:MAG: hypothetical protein CVT91_05170 [Candidatus Atribacteria bacterium HGW-Atribacteria-1]